MKGPIASFRTFRRSVFHALKTVSTTSALPRSSSPISRTASSCSPSGP